MKETVRRMLIAQIKLHGYPTYQIFDPEKFTEEELETLGEFGKRMKEIRDYCPCHRYSIPNAAERRDLEEKWTTMRADEYLRPEVDEI